jgi:hypothetical protein
MDEIGLYAGRSRIGADRAACSLPRPPGSASRLAFVLKM